MGFAKQYFRRQESDPAPLIAEAKRRVRFEDIDALGMVWHGRFPSYLEDGRIAFGDKYGLSYHTFRENNTVAPVVQMHLDYKHPLRFDENIIIESALHWADAARLNYSYAIYNQDGMLAASGYTVQLMTEPDGTVLLVAPDWLNDFKRKWRDGFAGKKG